MMSLSPLKFGAIYKIAGLEPKNTRRFVEDAAKVGKGALSIEVDSVPYLVTGSEADDYRALKRAVEKSPAELLTDVEANLKQSFIEEHKKNIKTIDLFPKPNSEPTKIGFNLEDSKH